jgi:hypothetical protein
MRFFLWNFLLFVLLLEFVLCLFKIFADFHEPLAQIFYLLIFLILNLIDRDIFFTINKV